MALVYDVSHNLAKVKNTTGSACACRVQSRHQAAYSTRGRELRTWLEGRGIAVRGSS
ncbi:hypothetical protein [Microbispora sp. H11081]|uniref:hypothetical protein n=1 Tax=Microbispora sp. H11081 TaxID=2729107 RepID=UPI001472FD95|nr:hypothetical protein [Microbispora sp. H11081]